jgi:hypothetical protein
VERDRIEDVLALQDPGAAVPRRLLVVELAEREAACRRPEHEREDDRGAPHGRSSPHRAGQNSKIAPMTAVSPLQPPASNVTETATYVAQPRAKRSFNTVLDAARIFAHGGRSVVTTTASGEGASRRVLLKTEHPLQGGLIAETFELAAATHLVPLRLERKLLDQEGVASREERIEFRKGPLELPEACYPEVMLPFLLRWQPEGPKRSFYAWIVDRFVAKVYFEVGKTVTVDVAAGRFEAAECVMYPDLNDWVHLGSIITSMAKPLLPKYRMWFEKGGARRVVKFEGPYGPPGAPEIVLELAS